jgi:hypothetical protein
MEARVSDSRVGCNLVSDFRTVPDRNGKCDTHNSKLCEIPQYCEELITLCQEYVSSVPGQTMFRGVFYHSRGFCRTEFR